MLLVLASLSSGIELGLRSLRVQAVALVADRAESLRVSLEVLEISRDARFREEIAHGSNVSVGRAQLARRRRSDPLDRLHVSLLLLTWCLVVDDLRELQLGERWVERADRRRSRICARRSPRRGGLRVRKVGDHEVDVGEAARREHSGAALRAAQKKKQTPTLKTAQSRQPGDQRGGHDLLVRSASHRQLRSGLFAQLLHDLLL